MKRCWVIYWIINSYNLSRPSSLTRRPENGRGVSWVTAKVNMNKPKGTLQMPTNLANSFLIFRGRKGHPFKMLQVTLNCTVPRQPLTRGNCPDILRSNRRVQKSILQLRRQPFRMMIKVQHRNCWHRYQVLYHEGPFRKPTCCILHFPKPSRALTI